MKILTPLQTRFLDAFFQTYLKNDFFLTGGTALSAFYFHHRLSEDLDLFTLIQQIEFNTINAEILKIIVSFGGKIEHQVSSPTFLQFIFRVKKERLKVDVVKDTSPHFGKIKKIQNFQIDSLENIAVGKLLALFGRADAKDFVDLYFLLKVKKAVAFEKLFRSAKKKDSGLSEFYLAGMISKVTEIRYFPKTLIPLDKEELVIFFLDLSNDLYQKIRPQK